MNPYSHIVVASKLETLVNPDNKPEYYWGAIVPDIRYIADLHRQQTHLSPQQIISFIPQHPHLRSFLQGYLVHCLSDELELEQIFFQHFPFFAFKDRMSRSKLAVILEFFYYENESINPDISVSHNEFLESLGITRTLSEKFSKSITQYSETSSSETRLLNSIKLMGLENDSRVEKYVAAARSFQKNQLLKNSMFFGIRTGKISEQIVSTVASHYQRYSQ